MVELLLDLEFACCSCECPVGVTVRCEGKGLTDRRTVVAACHVTCPHCQQENRVCFEPGGEIRDVGPAHQVVLPSLN